MLSNRDATVKALDRLFTTWTVINRVSPYGSILLKRNNHSIKSITTNVAYELFDEAIKDKFTVGKFADFVILDYNPMKVKPMDI